MAPGWIAGSSSPATLAKLCGAITGIFAVFPAFGGAVERSARDSVPARMKWNRARQAMSVLRFLATIRAEGSAETYFHKSDVEVPVVNSNLIRDF
jgi:hypothetical protein